MFGLLALLFLLVPLAELVLIIQVGSAIGALNTIALLILVSVVGAWLVRREGLSVLGRAQRQLDAGRVPTTSLVDGVLILAAGALLLTPGFLTDALGVLLLLPPVRAGLRRVLVARCRRRLVASRAGGPRVTVWRTTSRPVNVVDVEEHHDAAPPPGPPPDREGRHRPLRP